MQRDSVHRNVFFFADYPQKGHPESCNFFANWNVLSNFENNLVYNPWVNDDNV